MSGNSYTSLSWPCDRLARRLGQGISEITGLFGCSLYAVVGIGMVGINR